jgi:hypothetical protein
LAIRVSVAVSNTEIDPVSGLTIATNLSLPVIATVPDFEGRASTGAPVSGPSSPPLLHPPSGAPAAAPAAASIAIQEKRFVILSTGSFRGDWDSDLRATQCGGVAGRRSS